MRTLASRVLLTAVAVFTGVSPYAADWNETHIYNPAWTPHAKFHNGQTMSFAAVLAVLTLVYAWRRGGSQRENLIFAAILGSMYWVTQGMAHFFPGVAIADPGSPFAATPYILGLTPQGFIDVVTIAITLVAAGLALTTPSKKSEIA